MKTEDLTLFHQVVEHHSFSDVARIRDVPVANVSRRIKALENDLGVELFQRTTRQLRITDRGRQLYDRTLKIVSELSLLIDEFNDSSGVIKGKIRIQVPPDSNDLLPVMREFQRIYPEVEIDLFISTAELDLIANNIDLAFRVGPLSDSSQIGRLLGTLSMMVVASPGYLEQHSTIHVPSDLSQHNCLLLRRPNGNIENRWQVDRHNESVHVSGDITVNQASLLLELLLAGEGISWVPTIMVGEYITQGRLVQIFPEVESSAFELWMVYTSKNLQTTLLKTFIAYMVEEVPKRLLQKV